MKAHGHLHGITGSHTTFYGHMVNVQPWHFGGRQQQRHSKTHVNSTERKMSSVLPYLLLVLRRHLALARTEPSRRRRSRHTRTLLKRTHTHAQLFHTDILGLLIAHESYQGSGVLYLSAGGWGGSLHWVWCWPRHTAGHGDPLPCRRAPCVHCPGVTTSWHWCWDRGGAREISVHYFIL